jgi:polar amino acid transport system substrate-binding protein
MLNLRDLPTFFCAALLCAANTRALAADDSACGHLKLAFYEHGALYYKNENGDYAGIDKDVVDELARRTGCQFDTVLESRVRIWKQMESNLLDLTVSGIPNQERRAYANFFLYISSKNYVLLQRACRQQRKRSRDLKTIAAYVWP